MRINFNINDELLAKVDAKAKELSVNRTAYISMAVSQKLQSDDMVKALPELYTAMKSLGEKLKNEEKKS